MKLLLVMARCLHLNSSLCHPSLVGYHANLYQGQLSNVFLFYYYVKTTNKV